MSVSLIQQRIQELDTINTAQPHEKPLIDTGAELRVKGLRELIGPHIKSRQEMMEPAPVSQGSNDAKLTSISLQDKVVSIKYINAKSTEVEDEITLQITHWFIAAIMNLFAKIFPCCVQGAAKFLINDQVCYVRRALIQEKLHISIRRNEFISDPAVNTLKLKVLSFDHFQGEDAHPTT